MDDNENKPFRIKPLIPPLVAFALEAGGVGLGFAGLNAGVVGVFLLLAAVIMPVIGIIICSSSVKSKENTALSYVLCWIFLILPIPVLLIALIYLGLVISIVGLM